MTIILIVIAAAVALYIGYGIYYSRKVVRPWIDTLDREQLKRHFAQMRLNVPLDNDNQVQAARLGYVASTVVIWPRVKSGIRQWNKNPVL